MGEKEKIKDVKEKIKDVKDGRDEREREDKRCGR